MNLGEYKKNQEEKNNLGELLDITSKIKVSNKIIKVDILNTKLSKFHIENSYKNIKELIKKKKINIASYLLSITASFGIFYASASLVSPRHYEAKETSYSVEFGEEVKDIELPVSDYNGDKVYIKVMEPWTSDERETRTYDVSDVSLNNIEDYLNVDLNGRDYETTTDYFKDLNSYDQLNAKQIKQIITISLTDKKAYRENVIYLTFFGFLMFALGRNIADYCMLIYENQKHAALGLLGLIIKNTHYQKEIAYNVPESNDMKAMERILDGIYANETLRNRFVELFNENKHLLLDPSALLEEYKKAVDDLDMNSLKEEYEELNKKCQEVRKLIKKRN